MILSIVETMKPKVTVYITNHNYGRFVGQAIESVLKQTFLNYELLVIDDGSTDNSAEILAAYQSDPRISMLFQENKGLPATNNIALGKARGEYVMRLDADDILDEHALAILVAVLDRNPNVGLVFPDYFITDEHGTVREVMRRHNFETVSLLDSPAHGACTLIRKRCLEELGGYDENYRCQDGYELWLRFIHKYEVKNVNIPLFYYRQHGASISKNEQRILETRAEIFKKQLANKDTGSFIAIVPVRGAQYEPELDPLKKLGDKCLLDWTLNAIKAAENISGAVVTTADKQVYDYVNTQKLEGIIAVLRDEQLAKPNTHIEETLLDALAKNPFVETPTGIVVLYIDAPFRTGIHIDSAINVLTLFQTDSVIGVRPDSDIFYRHTGGGLEPIRNQGTLRLERDLWYREAGHMQVVRTSYLKEHRSLVGGTIGHVIIDAHASFRLRNEWDWQMASAWLTTRREK